MKPTANQQEAFVNPLALTNTVRLELPAIHKYLNVIGSCIHAMLDREQALKEQDSLFYNIELAVHEACTNIVEHAYAGISGRIEIAFTLSEEPRQFIIELRDRGQSFNLADVQSPDLEQPQTSGYGLFLVHQLMDEVSYFPEPGNNRWRLVKNF
ncbi:MAG: ATP-binding protein [Anaerolineales bacterium]|nr:ATP-binding protein [Anaerolineales bacterium]